MTTKNAIVWTKTNSQDCLTAISTLKKMGYTVEERNTSAHNPWDNAALLAAIPSAKSVPQIVIDETVIGGLTELRATQEFKSYQDAAKSAYQARMAVASAPRASMEAKQAAAAAAQSDRLQAYRQNTLAPDNSTRETRHAARDAKVQANLARHAAAQPARISTPQGYETGTCKDDAPELHQARYEENKAARAAQRAADAPALAERTAAYASASKARIQAATQARIARLGH
jgi:glutaredoxin